MAREINLFEQEQIEIISPEKEEQSSNLSSALPDVLDQLQAAQKTQQQERFARQHAKRVIEALLFVSSDPLPFTKIREVVDTFEPLKPRIVRDLIMELQEEYLSQQRAFRLEEIAQGFLLRTCEEYSPYIDILLRNKRTEKLSQASAEVLAIIAYRQPITRPQMEAIRGVDCSGIVQNLLERQLIEALGKLEAPGRPTLYGITKDFLKHFGLRDIQELSTHEVL
ncbi:MAG: SMC-Scp complex subunit ScpB [Parachlamydiaceae bacterium]|nr:SMC-Scp complex subunit ScpB [Parachlamydiaceae bacterium]